MKQRTAIVLFIGVLIAMSLTACQQSGGEVVTDSGQAEGTAEEAENGTNTTETEKEAVQPESISLELTFIDSPEFQACAEWNDFEEGYDTDGAILAEAGNEPIAAGYKYIEYFCYSKEMEDKIDEICEKYGLILLSGCQIIDTYSDLLSGTGVGDFCKDSENVKHNVVWGYLYDDGTFMIEGNVTLAGSSICEVSYQFARAVKGTFTTAYMNLDFSEYSARAYTTHDGENVFILCGVDKHPKIIAETEKSFIIINVLGDLSDISDVNDERLEMLADVFDFAAIP
ncbi:MAG: hypothetical protein K2J95_01505 [Lachnospiraceae bacterium]|nr:hypothetical protein [Lachnospiraceae bacterium]